MEDTMQTKESTEPQAEDLPTNKFSFKEKLRRQNIKTVLEIYGEQYLKK